MHVLLAWVNRHDAIKQIQSVFCGRHPRWVESLFVTSFIYKRFCVLLSLRSEAWQFVRCCTLDTCVSVYRWRRGVSRGMTSSDDCHSIPSSVPMQCEYENHALFSKWLTESIKKLHIPKHGIRIQIIGDDTDTKKCILYIQ